MPDPSWSWWVGELRSGKMTTKLPVSGGQWQQVMDDAGQFSVTVALTDPDVVNLNLRGAAEPCRCFLMLAYNDAAGVEWLVDGGPIWTHSYDAGTRQLSIGAAGLWSLFDHRFVLPVLAAGQSPAAATVSFAGLSLGGIATQLVGLAMSHPGGSLPVVLPTAETGTATRTYPGYSMTTVGQALRDLTQVQGGPEIQFVPRRNPVDGRYVQWVMRVGTTAQPLLTQGGADHVWDFTATRTSVQGLSVQLDGSQMAERVWVQGAGTDVSTLFGRADNLTLVNAGFPLLEALDSNHSGEKGASDPATLAAYAQADVAADVGLVETWTAVVQRDDAPALPDYAVGDWCVFNLPTDDPYLDRTGLRCRVTGRQGDLSTSVTLQVQPEIAS